MKRLNFGQTGNLSIICLTLAVAICMLQGCGELQKPFLAVTGTTGDDTVAFSGRVVGPEGDAVAGLALTIEPDRWSASDFDETEQQLMPPTTVTDPTGAFSLLGITSGRVALALLADNYEEGFYPEPEYEILSIKIGEILYHQNEPPPFGGIIFTITPGVHVQEAVVTVKRRMRIVGRIVFNDGTPLANARVSTNTERRDLDGNGSSSSGSGAQTDAEGKFIKYVDEGGLFWISIEYEGLSVTSEQFVLNDGERREDLVLTLDSEPIEPMDAETGGTARFNERAVWVVNPANGHAYKSVYVQNRDEAQALAAAQNAYLVAINDEAEQQWLESIFGPEPFWLGLSDAETEGEWLWDSGEPLTYTDWSRIDIFPSEEEDADKDYAVSTFRGEWQAVGPESPFWNITRRAILEAEEVPPDMPMEE